MNRFVRHVARPALVVAISASILAGCGDRESKIDDVRAAMAATRRAATSFVYSTEEEGETYKVTGVIADDFRFKALVAANDAPWFEEIVYDDALAMRVHNPDLLARLVDRGRVDSADLDTEIEGANVLQVLNSRRWVVDPEGAPSVTTFGVADQELGEDPVYDALTALDYVDRALVGAVEVVEFRADALNPVYPRTEDVFPKPDRGSGVVRYDLRRGRLPSITQQGGAGGQQALPNISHFRKMAIYVKDGRVLRVLERVEVIGKFVEDLHGYLDNFVRESRLSDALTNEFKAIERLGNTPEAGKRYLEFLNKVLVGLGGDPIKPRIVSMEFTPGSGADVEVALPTADVVQGSLEVMLASRAAKTQQDTVDEAQPDAGGDETPVTGPDGLPVDPEAPDDGSTDPTAPGAPPPGEPPAEPSDDPADDLPPPE